MSGRVSRALRQLDWWAGGFVAAVAASLTVGGYLLHDWWPLVPGALTTVLYLAGSVVYGRRRRRR